MLRERTWQRFPSGYDDAMLRELYEPALSRAVRYDRCCAYFSSSILAAAARGFGGLIQTLLALGDSAPRPAVRLLVNEQLAREDVDALLGGGDTSRIADQLLSQLLDPVGVLETKRLEMLAFLVREGLLEIKVGVMKSGQGILHAKFGVITDQQGDSIVFGGSSNESRSGLQLNYENLEVSTSWQDPERLEKHQQEFEFLWQGQHPLIDTFDLPDAVTYKLIQFAPEHVPTEPHLDHLPRQRAQMLVRYALEAPFMAGGGDTMDALAPVGLWPHQRGVVREVAEAWPEGRLLCDEVGMGKTLEAIMALRRLLAGRGVGRALLLVPAGLLRQWQGELREKGGLLVPRLDGSTLTWPDGSARKVSLEEALHEKVLLMSREAARLPHNREVILRGSAWDVVILDESHAARRRNVSQVGEYNSASLLLELLRQLQLRQKARSLMLLSATPMQTHAWEPWDLLAVLGEGGPWLADFDGVERLYHAASVLETQGKLSDRSAEYLAYLIAQDELFPPLPGLIAEPRDEQQVRTVLRWPRSGTAPRIAQWLRERNPLGRRMHRNTRETLREYHRQGLLTDEPTRRDVQDVIYEFSTTGEREVYDQVKGYIDRRFAELAPEEQRSGKGFVLTVYRRRAASSLRALTTSLERRAAGLQSVISAGGAPGGEALTALEVEDLPDDDDLHVDVGSSFPTSPRKAAKELGELQPLLTNLYALGITDSKLGHLRQVLGQVTADGRSVLIFSQYADTMDYLRRELARDYGEAVASYSGEGGAVFRAGQWKSITKDEVTALLRQGHIQFLVCTDAASEGLNLQAAGAIVNYDLPWNPSRVEQRIGRVDRIGQQRSQVRIVNLYLKDSVDDQVYRALRARCGLFEHFVGEMQPVLAAARRMLDGREAVDLGVLASEAAALTTDHARRAAYQRSRLSAPDLPDPALTLAELCTVLEENAEELGLRISGNVYELAGVLYAADQKTLEHDESLRPLSVLDVGLRGLPGGLSLPDERLPLVTGTAQQGAFRRTVMLWVQGEEATEISNLADLRNRVHAWDGKPVHLPTWLKAAKTAQQQATGDVAEMSERTQTLGQNMLKRQRQAARFRLTWQLGKFLACYDADLHDPNRSMYRRMTAEGTGELSAQRLNRVYTTLGGYPQWDTAVVTDLRNFAKALKNFERKNRQTGKQIDAALDDPRWQAKGT